MARIGTSEQRPQGMRLTAVGAIARHLGLRLDTEATRRRRHLADLGRSDLRW